MSETNSELVLIAKENGIEQMKVESLLQSFGKSFQDAKKLSQESKDIVVTDEKQVDVMQKARTARLALKQVRVDVENNRRSLKEQSLREGKAIDGMANIIKALIIPVEENLERQEKFAEIKDAERKSQIKAERIEMLSKYSDKIDAHMMSVYMGSLDNMADDVFAGLLLNVKSQYDLVVLAEKKAEAERIAKEKAEREENERVRKENEKLRKDAEDREKAAAEERKKANDKLSAERKANEEKVSAEKKAREEAEEKLRLEREEKEKKERKEREDEEARKKADEEAKRALLLAPDKEKLNKLASDIDSFVFPAVESQGAGEALYEARKQLTHAANYLRTRAKTL